MDTESGKIYDPDQLKKLADTFGEGDNPEVKMKDIAEKMKLKEMQLPLTEKQQQTRTVDKYDPCPCGSGKQFKWCCYTGNEK